ncbi:MAG: hypothetical protein ACJA2X_002258 [Halocynthiibacter sp.]|jgi:hypothetical protein
MTRIFRPLTAILLALMLLATTGAMASARGTMRDAAGQMVLCIGTGSVTVNVDADGQPIKAGHICPDCALGHFDATFARAQVPDLIERASVLGRDYSVEIGLGRAEIYARARSPPIV